jgi:hypothetical protein
MRLKLTTKGIESSCKRPTTLTASEFLSRCDVSANLQAAAAEIEACKAWLTRNTSRRDRPTPDAGSYQLKHRVERESTPLRYIPNGAMILAATELGFTVRILPGSLNTTFGMKFNRRV